MISLRSLILLSFLNLLLSSITFALVCPFTIQSLDSGSQEEHLVFLKTSILSIQSVVSDHKEMLIKCLGRRVEKSSPGQGIFSSSSNNNKPDKNLITDHSTDGKFSIYSGFFDKKFVDTLSKRSDVNFVEKVIKIKANYAVNNTVIIEEDQLKKRAATSTPTQNGLPYVSNCNIQGELKFNFYSNKIKLNTRTLIESTKKIFHWMENTITQLVLVPE